MTGDKIVKYVMPMDVLNLRCGACGACCISIVRFSMVQRCNFNGLNILHVFGAV